MKRKSFVLVLLLTALLFLGAGCSMTQPSGESPSAPDSRTQEMDEEASNDSTINEFKRETSEISQKVDTVVPIENDMNEKLSSSTRLCRESTPWIKKLTIMKTR